MVNSQKTLYYCITYYQVYIAIIKKLVEKSCDADIVLSDVIPNSKKLKKRLYKSKIFKNVFLLKEKDYVKKRRDKFHKDRAKMGKMCKIFLSKIKWIKSQNDIINYASRNIKFDVNAYNDIFVFGQGRAFAPYLFAKKKKYILVEDSIDYFRMGINSLVDRNRMSYPRRFYYVNRFLDLIGLYYYMGGYSHAESAIEVNKNENLVFQKCALKKVTEVPRKKMIERLSTSDKEIIYAVFAEDNLISFSREENTCLILTNPFLYDGLVDSELELVLIYKKLIKEECEGYKNIFIKPHPRDFVEYENFIKELGSFTLIHKDIPIEILNFRKDICFDKAIAISSTAIQQADYVKNKVNLGMDWFDIALDKVRREF